jgi:hypothetical protein
MDKPNLEAAVNINPDSVPDEIDPVIVAAKVAAGLTKDQAIEVCLAQIENDKAMAKAAKSKKSA